MDRSSLLTGAAGTFISEATSLPLTSLDLRTYDEKDKPWIPGTKAICWMGDGITTPCGSSPYGYITSLGPVRHAQSWTPQDSVDMRHYEGGGSEDEDDDVSDRDTKDAYPTRRANYRFWTQEILRKLLRPIPVYPTLNPVLRPPLAQVIPILDAAKDGELYLDIETSRAHRAISCIGFSTSSTFPAVFVVPIYNYQGQIPYDRTSLFLFHRALSRAFQRNQVVIHNSHFDLLILRAWYKFHLPLAVYDTMLAGHRCYPEAEKSLSHNMVRWTWLPYHKNVATDVFSAAAERAMWLYNARDVFALKIIKDAQEQYAAEVPGLSDSITQANISVIPYLSMTLTGMPVDSYTQLKMEESLTLAKAQYERICGILAGNNGFNPGSTKQCAAYFHTKLGYPVVGRTETGAPKLGRKQFYQLLMKHDNPLLKAVMAYKKAAKDLSMLGFNYWSMPAAPEAVTKASSIFTI